MLSYQLAGGLSAESDSPPSEADKDWAILTLADDLSDSIRPLQTAEFNQHEFASLRGKGANLIQAGYNRDYAHALTANRPCDLKNFSMNGRLVRHDCDATFGASGSPILLELNGLYRLIAMLVGIDSQGAGIAVTGAVFNGVSKAAASEKAPSGGKAEAC